MEFSLYRNNPMHWKCLWKSVEESGISALGSSQSLPPILPIFYSIPISLCTLCFLFFHRSSQPYSHKLQKFSCQAVFLSFLSFTSSSLLSKPITLSPFLPQSSHFLVQISSNFLLNLYCFPFSISFPFPSSRINLRN